MLRIIGDVHGKLREYCNIAKAASHSLQLGDMAHNYDQLGYEREYAKLNDEDHKFFGGNHDNYDMYNDLPYSLGDWGVETLGGVKYFFVRGAFSIDHKQRKTYHAQTGIKVWWEQEELTITQANKCLHDYIHAQPNVVITHGCPKIISEIIGNTAILVSFGYQPDQFTTTTQRLLQAMLEIHQPDMWIFGHFHHSWKTIQKGVKFQCLDELDFVDLEI